MRAQSEAVGLAIIVMLVIGSIIAYAILQGDDTPAVSEADLIIADNFAYTLLYTDVPLSCADQPLVRVLERLNERVDPCDVRTSLTDAEAEGLAETYIENVTNRTISRWGYGYELSVHPEGEPDDPLYSSDGDCGFSRRGIEPYLFGRPRVQLTFALCS